MSCCCMVVDFNDLLVFLERISWIGCPAQVLGWVLTEQILSQKPKKPKKSKKSAQKPEVLQHISNYGITF